MKSNQNSNHVPNQNIISLLWSKYFPYWPIFLLLLATCLAGAWFYLQKTTPLYAATATLMIKDEKKGIDDSRMIESLNLLSTKKIVENEIEVLASRSLMEEVVNNLRLYAPVFKKAKWRDKEAYSVSPIRIEIQDPATITETLQINFSFDVNTQTVIINKSAFPLNQWVNTSYGTLKFIPANTKINPVEGQLYFSLVNLKKVVLALMKRLEAIPSSKLSTVIDLELKDEDPALAEDILNQLILVYNRAAVNDKNALAVNTLSFVQERLDFVGRHLDSIERKIQEYKASKGAVDIGSQGKIFLENVSVNDQKVADINMQLAALEQVEKYILSKDKNGGIVPSTLDDPNSLLPTLLKKLYEAELEKEKIRKTAGENNPAMIALTDQIEKIKPSILENIQSQRRSLEASRGDLKSTNNNYSSLLQSIPQKERDLVEISRQQNIENNIYSFLLQKREEAALSNSSTVADNRIIDKAQSSLMPVSPSKKIILLVAVFAALALGVSIITVKELFSRSILYRTDIEDRSAFPIIGEIGFEKTKKPIALQEGATSLVAEQFRKLRTSLTFIDGGGKARKILLTSTIPGEGKSYITCNLGLSLAMLGKKVILVETDLRNPTLSQKLDIHEEKGLSNYLSGECKPEDVIKVSNVNPNLFIIAAGSATPNPSEMLLNGKMEELIIYLENIFDYVLLDTAPVGMISDAYALSPLCNATFYIVRHNYTPKIAIERLDNNNTTTELKNMVIVFNGVRSRGFTNDNYGYNYGYNYNRK